MNQKEMLNCLCNKVGLGKLQEEPVKLTGGLLHKMYCVVTECGKYAVKVLNPDIMKRPDALQNMINGELVSNALEEIVPVVAARAFRGEYVIRCGGVYYMVFDWLDGKSVFGQDITVSHCAKIGEILGRIHAADVRIPGMQKEESVREVYDWEVYWQEVKKMQDAGSMQSGESRQMAQDTENGQSVQIVQGAGEKKTGDKRDEVCKESWMTFFTDNVERVKHQDVQAVLGLQALSAHQVISHRDLDPKNVMWQQDRPYVIDWEAAGYVNPYQELVEVLNYWTVEESGNYDRAKFKALIGAYVNFVDIGEVNWEAVLYGSMDSMLGWLEYNVKRALGLEGTKSEDRSEGEKQVKGTIRELSGYTENMEMCREWLSV